MSCSTSSRETVGSVSFVDEVGDDGLGSLLAAHPVAPDSAGGTALDPAGDVHAGQRLLAGQDAPAVIGDDAQRVVERQVGDGLGGPL